MTARDAGSKQVLCRILDANQNRVIEGLRVCEEIARFVLERPTLTRRIRSVRHDLAEALRNTAGAERWVVSRDVRRDVGRSFWSRRYAAGRWQELLLANASRVKEALRVLEEFGRLLDEPLAAHVQRIRFRFYGWEQAALAELARLRYH